MKVVLDLSILLDVLQKRKYVYVSSASVIQLVVEEKMRSVLPEHFLTTLYFVTARHSSKRQAELLIDWALKYFEIGVESKVNFLRAKNMQCRDFEEAVVASVAELERCQYIITRNVKVYRASPVPATTPEEFLINWKE